MRGQYFSFDAIVASVIFMLGMALLLGQWFSVKQSTDLTSEYLAEDAFRSSDILLSQGVPVDWFTPPSKLAGLSGVRKVGLGMSPQGQVLNISLIEAIKEDYTSGLWGWGAAPTQYYNSFRAMLGIGTHAYIVVVSNELVVPPGGGPPSPKYRAFMGYTGGMGAQAGRATEFVHVRRIVAFEDTSHLGRLVPGRMDIYIYKNTSIG